MSEPDVSHKRPNNPTGPFLFLGPVASWCLHLTTSSTEEVLSAEHIVCFPPGPVICRSQPTSVCDFIVPWLPRGSILSLRPSFKLQPALQFCAPLRASSLHLFCRFQLCIAALARLQEHKAESRRRCRSRAGSQSHLNLRSAPAASPPPIHFFSALPPTDALLDFVPSQPLCYLRPPPLLPVFVSLQADIISRTQNAEVQTNHCVLLVLWPTPGQPPGRRSCDICSVGVSTPAETLSGS